MYNGVQWCTRGERRNYSVYEKPALPLRRYNPTRKTTNKLIATLYRKQAKIMHTYMDNMQSILIEQDVRLEIGLTRPASSVVATGSKSNQRAADRLRSFDARTPPPDYPIRAQLGTGLSRAVGTCCVHRHRSRFTMTTAGVVQAEANLHKQTSIHFIKLIYVVRMPST